MASKIQDPRKNDCRGWSKVSTNQIFDRNEDADIDVSATEMSTSAGVIQNVPLNESDVPINVPINNISLQVLHTMKDDPKSSLDEIAVKIGRTRKTVQRIVSDLKKDGYL